MTERIISLGRRPVPARAAVLAALFSLAIGLSLSQIALDGHGPSAPAARALHGPRRDVAALPSAAWPPISAAIGAERPAFRVVASGSAGFRAGNPSQHLVIGFGRSGLRVGSGGTELGLRLEAIGEGSALRPVAAVAPAARDNRVTYARGGLTEWYANGPLGLEQGFVLTRAPRGGAGGTLTLSLAVSG